MCGRCTSFAGTLEGLAASLAAQNADDAERAVINDICIAEAELIRSDAAPDVLARHNRQFHHAIQAGDAPDAAAAMSHHLDSALKARLTLLSLTAGQGLIEMTGPARLFPPWLSRDLVRLVP